MAIELATLASLASLMGINAKDLVIHMQNFRKENKDKNLEKWKAERLDGLKEIVEKGWHTTFLHLFYTDSQLQRVDLARFTVNLDGSPKITANIVVDPELDKFLCEYPTLCEAHEFNPKSPEAQLDEGLAKKVLEGIEDRGLNIWEQPLFRLLELDVKGGSVKANFSLESFFKYRLSLGALWDELTDGLIACDCNPNELYNQRDKHLPIRKLYLPDARKIKNFGDRICVGGVTTTIAIQRPPPWRDFVIPIPRRSMSLSSGQGMLAVIPQGYHQPTVNPEDEIDFRWTFLRELFEELFGGEESVNEIRRLRHDWFMAESSPLKWLRDNQDQYVLKNTGIGFNLTSGNFEVAQVCVIENPYFWQEYGHKMISGWEAIDDDKLVPLVSTKEKQLLLGLLKENDWDGTSYFSFAKALAYLRETGGNLVDIPNFDLESS